MNDSAELITAFLKPLGVGLVPGTLQEIESLESKMLGLPQIKYTQQSYHAPGIWVRELRAPAGSLIIGHEHRHANLNILAQGSKIMVIGDRVERMTAPYCVPSGLGIRKIGLILTDMVWFSIHHNPTNEQDEEKLEELFYRKSGTFKAEEIRRAEEKLAKLKACFPTFGREEEIAV